MIRAVGGLLRRRARVRRHRRRRARRRALAYGRGGILVVPMDPTPVDIAALAPPGPPAPRS